MTGDPPLFCPCGEPAPSPLPGTGKSPVRCPACATPLVRRTKIPGSVTERAAGAALVAAPLTAVGWTWIVLSTGSGAHWALPLAAIVSAVAARVATRLRGPAIQFGGIVGFVVFVLLGEVLIYRTALLPRLVALHRAESAGNPETRGAKELAEMTVSDYLHIELSVGLFAGVVAGLMIVAWLCRAPAAVAAFERPPPPPPPEPAPEPLDDERVNGRSTDDDAPAADDDPVPPAAAGDDAWP